MSFSANKPGNLGLLIICFFSALCTSIAKEESPAAPTKLSSRQGNTENRQNWTDEFLPLEWFFNWDSTHGESVDWQIVVADSLEFLTPEKANVWNPGWRNDRAICKGPIQSPTSCWWKVRERNEAGYTSEWSPPRKLIQASHTLGVERVDQNPSSISTNQAMRYLLVGGGAIVAQQKDPQIEAGILLRFPHHFFEFQYMAEPEEKIFKLLENPNSYQILVTKVSAFKPDIIFLGIHLSDRTQKAKRDRQRVSAPE